MMIYGEPYEDYLEDGDEDAKRRQEEEAWTQADIEAQEELDRLIEEACRDEREASND